MILIFIYTLEMKLNEPRNIILETFNPDDQQWKENFPSQKHNLPISLKVPSN